MRQTGAGRYRKGGILRLSVIAVLCQGQVVLKEVSGGEKAVLTHTRCKGRRALERTSGAMWRPPSHR